MRMALGEAIVNPDGDRTSPVRLAGWNSDCEGGDTIDEGEEIVAANGAFWHKECAIKAGYRVPR